MALEPYDTRSAGDLSEINADLAENAATLANAETELQAAEREVIRLQILIQQLNNERKILLQEQQLAVMPRLSPQEEAAKRQRVILAVRNLLNRHRRRLQPYTVGDLRQNGDFNRLYTETVRECPLCKESDLIERLNSRFSALYLQRSFGR